YEGYSLDQLVLPVFLLHSIGVQTIVLTNAAGAINPAYRPGDIVLISDHLNLLGRNPLTGPNNDSLGPRFPDMTEVYDVGLRGLARTVAGTDLAEGVYAAVPGPSYETPAEVRMLKALGADLVGMSTVPEAIAARYLGMKVVGLSSVTNAAAGLGEGKLDHAEVVEVGKSIRTRLISLIEGLSTAHTHADK
ncbi:MAG: purine-nucleoside phosphorylase, partial [Spirochaetia bacterium]